MRIWILNILEKSFKTSACRLHSNTRIEMVNIALQAISYRKIEIWQLYFQKLFWLH